ncbi:MAG: CbbQ/NirQ/NorQ/GpvN family protein [Myxococcota bacterium]|nr:CbbQ/NirQ/NorQ/GpvN family protein [Myxococcota bacterium]
MNIYYRPIKNEVSTFKSAAQLGLPVLLKGPTGCGKTRFVRYMAEQLDLNLITVLCQEDLTAADLTGRYLIKGGDTVWQDGPLTAGVRSGAIVYLDEVVEARSDVLSVIHSLTDDRRILSLERTGEIIQAPKTFMLVVSYNPDPQNMRKRLQSATQQRFVSMTFDYPGAEIESEIVSHESGLNIDDSKRLVSLGQSTRRLQQLGLHQGASTRCLINAGLLWNSGMKPEGAIQTTLINSLTDDLSLREALETLVEDTF